MNSEADKVIKINTFAGLAMVLGLTSVILGSTVLIPLALGSFGIIFAVLSKEKSLKMGIPAKIGFISSIIGLATAIFIMATSVYLFETDDAYRENFNQTYEQIYGMSFDDYINETFDEYQNPDLINTDN